MQRGVYNYHRTYDPTTGRYLESDPIGIVAGPNTYMYAKDDPLSYIDPDGLNPILTVGSKILEFVCKGFSSFANKEHREYEEGVDNLWREWLEHLNESHLSAIFDCLAKSDECQRIECINKADEKQRRQEQAYWEEYLQLKGQNPWPQSDCPSLKRRRGISNSRR